MDLVHNFLERIEGEGNAVNDLDVNLELEEAFVYILALGWDDEDAREPFSWVKITVDINEYRYMEDPSFKLQFRMSRVLFEQLLTVVMDRTADFGWKKPKNYEVADILLMVLWILATPDSFRGAALRFGVTPVVLHFHYRRIIEVLSSLASSYVCWPSEAERAVIERHFEEDTGVPGVVGAINGTHIYISRLEEDNQRFVNRHGNHSIIMQAVCDNTLLFIRDICGGTWECP